MQSKNVIIKRYNYLVDRLHDKTVIMEALEVEQIIGEVSCLKWVLGEKSNE